MREEEIDRKTPRDSLIEEEKYEGLEKVLNTLTDREKIVIQMRTIEGQTLKKCGEYLGISTERIRQIESKALRKLRHPLRANKLIELFGLEIKPLLEQTKYPTSPSIKENKIKKTTFNTISKTREEILAEIQLREFWRLREKFTVVYLGRPDHPYFWSHTTEEDRIKRIIGYKDYYKTNFEELKLIFNETDISMAIAYLHGQRSELEGTLGEKSC